MTDVDLILKNLEEGKLSLEESMTQYEKGINLLKELEKELHSMEQKLTVIQQSSDGEIVEVSMENE